MELFVGRSQEIHELSGHIFGGRGLTQVICITGASGIGKTSLAYQLYYKADEQPYRARFEHKLRVAAYMEGWEHIIINVARELFSAFPSKVTFEELEDKILETIIKKKIFLFLDNVDQVDPRKIEAFIEKWIKQEHKSILLLTIRNKPFEGNTPGKCIVFELRGMREQFAIENLLGESLISIVGRNRIFEIAEQLGNVPQKLLYLRWRDSKNQKDLDECIQDFGSRYAGVDAIETALLKIPYPLTHFLALGRLRNPEFDESLLAFLWDRLGGGSTETYFDILHYLIAEKLIIPDERHQKYRLSAGVHIALERPLLKLVTPEAICYVDYFIAQYYRNLFVLSEGNTMQLDLLEHYVYHALRSNNFDSVYSYVFESHILNDAHNRGLSLELEPIIQHFNKRYSRLLDQTNLRLSNISTLAVQSAMIKIELGDIYHDLSQHQSCLNCMTEATNIMDKFIKHDINIDGNIKREIQRRIWYLSATSSSNLGRSGDCLNFYSQIIQEAVSGGQFTWFDALCLGYFAHDLRFHDIEKSEKFGRKALELSDKIGHLSTRVKNMGSLALTLFFAGKISESKKMFRDAYDLISIGIKDGRADFRELGRLLIHTAQVYISTKEWDIADQCLQEALELNRKGGDRRRAYSAIAHRAIVLYKQGEKEEGKKMLLNSIQQHREMGDWRYCTSEVMSYIWMVIPNFEGDLLKVNREDFRPEIQDCIRHIIEDKKLGIFVDFWIRRYRPILLES